MCLFWHFYNSVTYKVASIRCNTSIKMFFPLLRTVFELFDFETMQCFCHFLFHLFHISKMFLFEDFFHLGKQKSCPEWDRMNRKGEVWGSCCFWSKPAEFVFKLFSTAWAGVLVNHPSWNGQMCWDVKKIHWSWMQPLTTPRAGPLIQMGS